MVGSYLNATSTFFKGEKTAAQYGIFSSDWSGGAWSQTYASNFNDSGYYIGACIQVCNQTIDHARGQYSALGYSGTNSGGTLVIKNSEFDHNEEGVDTNSENTDFPSPQDGACPGGKRPTIAGAVGCWVFMNNYVHDNNNPNVPSAGAAALAPVGTGLSVSGGRNDTILHNRFVNNKAWGVIFIPFPDSGKPCSGGVRNFDLLGKGSCLFDELRRCADQQHVHQRRRLREPDERRLLSSKTSTATRPTATAATSTRRGASRPWPRSCSRAIPVARTRRSPRTSTSRS